MKESKAIKISYAALIAACYIVLTFVSELAGLASGPVQFRISEALIILPIFTPAAIPGLAIGCAISNMLTGCAVWDIIFGTLATLVGALGAYYLGKKIPYIAWIPNVIANMIVIPLVLQFVYGAEGTYWYFLLTIGLGEIVCSGGLGLLLYKALKNKIKYIK